MREHAPGDDRRVDDRRLPEAAVIVPWTDKRGVTHAWLAHSTRGDNHHAGWYTARGPCGASRRLRRGREGENRSRDAVIDCMTCLIRQGENDQ